MKIDVSKEEFADLVVAFIFDKMVREEELIPNNKEFSELVNKMKEKGLKSFFMKYYLGLDGRKKVHYKKFAKPLLTGKGKSVIDIQKPDDREAESETKKKKTGVVKKIFKKIIGNEAVTRKELAFLAEEFLMRED